MSIDAAYELLYNIVLVALLCLIGAALIRSVIGPRVTDRILCINMIGTMVISCIVLLSNKLEESYLCDVALIYAMLSFLAVLMMAVLFIPTQTRKKRFLEQAENREEKVRKMTGRRDGKTVIKEQKTAGKEQRKTVYAGSRKKEVQK